MLGFRHQTCLQARHVLCLQARHLLCLQPRHLLCQQTRDLQSAKTSPLHCPHRGGREAAAPVSAMPRGCLGRLQISCLLTQQMSWLQTQQMSCLQTQHMSCLQTIQVSCGSTRKAATQILGFWREKNGIFPWEAGFCYETLRYYAALDIVRLCGPGNGYPWAWWS